MATMISEVYNAFLAGGTPEAEARKAAEALSSENLSTKGDIAEVKEELTRDIAEVKEELTGRIAEVKEELIGRIAAVEEGLNRKIDAIDKKLTHEIYDIKQGMAVMKSLLLIILAAQVIPLLKALSVI